MPPEATGPELDALLETLKAQRGFDFTGYKRSSLARRIAKRLEAVGCPGYEAYTDYLEFHPGEFELLFNTILINVTAFYRDADAWDFVTEEALPEMLASKRAHEPVRVWSAGSASGEEAYTAAMVLSDLLGEDAYLERVKIYATDVDDEALDEARAGVYTAEQVEPLPEHLRERCFEAVEDRRVFRKDLRRTVIFGRNDLVQDAPISRIDLLLCRNTLMYFNADTQARVLGRFHFALQPNGVLFMGKSEMLLTHGELFEPINVKRRVFRPVPRPGAARAAAALDPRATNGRDGGPAALHDLVLEAGPIAQLVVDRDGVLQIANTRARQLLSLAAGDVGRPFKDLEVSFRPVELRSHVEEALATRLPAVLDSAEIGTDGDARVVEVALAPMLEHGEPAGVTVTFTDVTSHSRLQDELERSRRELEVSYEELQSTVEELETTNEELQSTNEELETTNEELQSANEELETMNEELQSTNEELETINEELRVRTFELNDVNSFLQAILESLGRSVVVLDRDLRVRVWNDESLELWGLTADETRDEQLLALDFGLPVAELKPDLRAVADGRTARAELKVDAVNRRGKPIRCDVSIAALTGRDGEVSGAIVMLVEAQPD